MILCMLVGSVLLGIFLYFFFTSGENAANELVSAMIAAETEKIEMGQIEMGLILEKFKAAKAAKREPEDALRVRGKKLKKQIATAKKRLETLRTQGPGVLDIPPLAGYQFMRMYRIDSSRPFVSRLQSKCMQYKERHEAIQYANYLVASLIGNIGLGIALFFCGTALGLALGLGGRALILGLAALGIFALLGYIPYDAVTSTVRKRDEAIERDFPRVVSKMALLIVSGIETMRAWTLTAQSGTGTLYEEMRRVLIDLDHNVTHEEALSKFIRRCNYPFATKFGTAIMQNYTKGNAEIVKVMRDLNTESWSEYKHSARRRGDAIANKLFIPTMMLFVGVIILVVVPAFSGFNM